MTETPAAYSVDDVISTAAADQDMALAINTAEAIAAHFGVLLAAGMEYGDAVTFAAKFSDVLLDQYVTTEEMTLSAILGGEL